MTTIWEDEAIEELNEAVKFIAKKSPQNAIMVLDGLLELADTLGYMPYKFSKEPTYNKEYIRVTIKYNYKLIYQVEKDRIIVLRVFSARQDPLKMKK